MSDAFTAGFQHGFFYGASAMALLAMGIWLAVSMMEDRRWEYARLRDFSAERKRLARMLQEAQERELEAMRDAYLAYAAAQPASFFAEYNNLATLMYALNKRLAGQ